MCPLQDNINDATRNLSASVSILAGKIDKLSDVINSTVGGGMLAQLAELTAVLKDVMGQRIVTAIDRVEKIINTTLVSANHITTQVDKTAKDATMDLNNTVR